MTQTKDLHVLFAEKVKEIQEEKEVVLNRASASLYWTLKKCAKYFHMPFEPEVYTNFDEVTSSEVSMQALSRLKETSDKGDFTALKIRAILSPLSVDAMEVISMCTEVESGIIALAEQEWDGTQENYHQFEEAREEVSERTFSGCPDCYHLAQWYSIATVVNKVPLEPFFVASMFHTDDDEVLNSFRESMKFMLDQSWEAALYDCSENFGRVY
jgi:hypothetical protein